MTGGTTHCFEAVRTSADGNFVLAYAWRAHVVHYWNLKTGDHRELQPTGIDASSLTFLGPSGRAALALEKPAPQPAKAGTRLYRVNLENSKSEYLFTLPYSQSNTEHISITGSPAGELFLVARTGRNQKASFELWNRNGTKTGATTDGSKPAFDPSGERIAYRTNGGTINILKIGGTTQETGTRDLGSCLQWSPNPRYILYCDASPPVSRLWYSVLDASTGQSFPLTPVGIKGPQPMVWLHGDLAGMPGLWGEQPTIRAGNN
jgi:WD40 repeat protein